MIFAAVPLPVLPVVDAVPARYAPEPEAACGPVAPPTTLIE